MVEGGNALLGVLSDFDDVFDCHAGNAMIFTSTYGERDFLARAIRCADSTDAACMTSCTYECSNYGYVEGQCYQGWTCTDACLVSSGTCSN